MKSIEASPELTLPGQKPIQLVDENGSAVGDLPDERVLRSLHRAMVLGRRFNRQATALTKQGRLAVYPSSVGQEACEVGATLALEDDDWLFPTYRDTVAVVTRGVPAVETLTLLRGNWHSGYDPYAHRVAPLCTPLATNGPHAVGLAHAARLRGDSLAVLVFMGDGATSEGDAHEAFNFAAVFNAPVVFFIQNNQWAISVPLFKQSKAPTLAHKAIGYGMPGYQVDGNDAAAVYTVVSDALARARSGGGPSIVEGLTYRIEPHTNSDDTNRYRDPGDAEPWRAADPIIRFNRLLGLDESAYAEEADRMMAELRAEMNQDAHVDPADLFEHVYAVPTPRLRAQRDALRAELAADRGEA
ncbi:thiamine pyrophosphate-dependent dehydrogenase E1 component subunit alpha [Kibdelosporangium philippinense]|uniref:2-oxoisovalerate dehydrogenase subunit alpha n=1 Tax=Kibdelosporangium philippinense TaxID=211113 RepID=A0ABS8ZI71_9PSEU|nr:thiamine pyrophosphate-dependent dehydrogenase E1 component subunit alpha [Kibdelosporangium philippinense]MCE7006625.1 thiamine pyrophosphate-dependent dehydrogenase E1 component subunit alpha [Kibdelosporangium philippinense]